jgi:hypothetical protein
MQCKAIKAWYNLCAYATGLPYEKKATVFANLHRPLHEYPTNRYQGTSFGNGQDRQL